VPGSLFSGVFRCQGADAWVAIELEDVGDWTALCSFLERGDLDLDEDGCTPGRRESLREAVQSWSGTVAPLQAALKLQKVGVAAGPVQNSEDMWRDAQLRSRGAFVEVRHPDVGLVEYPDSPNPMRRTRGGDTPRGPRMGEHTAAVLGEWLGCSQADVDGLRRSGAVWLPEVRADTAGTADPSDRRMRDARDQ